jgi:hypothetical protein
MTLFRSFETLRKGNAEALSTDNRWRDVMTAAQRGQAAPLAAVAQRSVDLVIDVGQGQEDRWVVTGRVMSEDDLWPTTPVDLNAVRAQVARLFRLLSAPDRLGETDRCRLLGQVLARAVLPWDLEKRFNALLQDEALRIDLNLYFREGADEDLVHLPWELLHLPARKPDRPAIMLGASPRLTLSRVLLPELRAAPATQTTDLAVTIVRGPGAPGGDKRIKETTDVVQSTLKDTLAREPAMLNDASQSTMEASLANGETDVLHYVGFGRYRGQRDEIAFRGDPDEPDAFLSADDFADSLMRARPPRLVVLQACQGPAGQVPADLSAMAPDLLMAGVAAVLVLPQSLEDSDDIRQLLKPFYKTVAAGESLQRAVQEVRGHPRFRPQPWLYPALFVRHPGELALVRKRRAGGQSGGP